MTIHSEYHIHLLEMLDGLGFPASKQDIILHAEGRGASEEVLDRLAGIPDDDYKTRSELLENIDVIEELPGQAEQIRVVSQVLGGPPAANHQADVLHHRHVPEGHVSGQVVAGRLLRDVPVRGPLVLDEVVDPALGAADVDGVPLLPEAEEWVEGVEHLGRVPDDQ